MILFQLQEILFIFFRSAEEVLCLSAKKQRLLLQFAGGIFYLCKGRSYLKTNTHETLSSFF